jgi:hypothetical protein
VSKAQPKRPEKDKDGAEVQRHVDEVLKRMLNTPPQPKKKAAQKAA